MTWKIGKRNGTVLEWDDGTVVSCNPPVGQLTHRPAGTNGPYEQCEVKGATVVYSPLPDQVFVFGFQPTIPNRPGMCAFTMEPLT